MRGRAGMKNSSPPTEGCLHVIIRGLIALFVRKICNISPALLSISLDGPLKPPSTLIVSPYQNNPSSVLCNGQYDFVCQYHISPSHIPFFAIILFLHTNYKTAGFAGDDAPRSVFPSLIGRARQPGIMVRYS